MYVLNVVYPCIDLGWVVTNPRISHVYLKIFQVLLDLENTLDSSGIYLTGLLVTQTHACIYLARLGISLGYPKLDQGYPY